jgi:hypothetical protein
LNRLVRFVRVVWFAEFIECQRVISTGFEVDRAAAPRGKEGSEVFGEPEEGPEEQADITTPDVPSRTRPPRKSLRFSRRSPIDAVPGVSTFVLSLLVSCSRCRPEPLAGWSLLLTWSLVAGRKPCTHPDASQRDT